MRPESLVQLIGSGNTATVEAEWMGLLESLEASPSTLRDYQPVLAELCRVGKASLAEEWAWTAIEAMSTRLSPIETLGLASSFLLAVGDSQELRSQVAELYRAAYAGQEGIDALLTEAGLAGGRPVRRALRTLDVCLPLKVGDYLAARDHDTVARVESIDRREWQFTFSSGQSSETLGAVELADRFRPAAATEFRVLRQYAPGRLAQRLDQEPAEVVIELCRQHDDSIDSETVERLLVPAPFSEDEFKKWWTRARTALKRCHNVKVEGRSPYVITYHDVPVAHDDALFVEVSKHRDPIAQLDAVEKYVRGCKDRGQTPSTATLRQCHELAATHARQLTEHHSLRAGLAWTVAWRMGELAGVDDASLGTVELFRKATDVHAVLRHIEREAMFDLACRALIEARPDQWRDQLVAMLPTLPMALCDRAASRLVEHGWTAAEFEPVVQRILASPTAYFEALLWLWDGPSSDELSGKLNPLTVLVRVLRSLDECRRSDTIPKEQAKTISARARTVLSARRYERFLRCLQGIDPGMAATLRTQIAQLDNLGRAVHEDLLTHLRERFPSRETAVTLEPWAREDVLYVTQAGLTKRRKEIEQHVNVKMRDNAKAIGAAGERGDLSENSEYKCALEERDLLRARLAQMNAELAMARVMTTGDVPTDYVGVGTRVVFEPTGGGERYETSFVSPWDADHAKGWFNYKAPLAQGIMGKRIGDVVRFEHAGATGEYRIVELHNALQSAVQTAPA